MAFLPADRPTASASNGSYFKPQDGENRVRILSDAVVGFVYWTNDNKPVRTRTEPTQVHDIRINDDGKPDRIKLFFAMLVWNYATSQIAIWEVTQRTIQDAIEGLADDEDWGHPKNYDLKISKTGKKLDVKYSIIAAPKKPVAPEIQAALAETEIDLNSLFSDSTATAISASPATSATFEKFEGMIDRADTVDKVNMAVQWALSPRQLPGMTEALGQDVETQVTAIADARKLELAAPSESYEEIPF